MRTLSLLEITIEKSSIYLFAVDILPAAGHYFYLISVRHFLFMHVRSFCFMCLINLPSFYLPQMVRGIVPAFIRLGWLGFELGLLLLLNTK